MASATTSAKARATRSRFSGPMASNSGCKGGDHCGPERKNSSASSNCHRTTDDGDLDLFEPGALTMAEANPSTVPSAAHVGGAAGRSPTGSGEWPRR